MNSVITKVSRIIRDSAVTANELVTDPPLVTNFVCVSIIFLGNEINA